MITGGSFQGGVNLSLGTIDHSMKRPEDAFARVVVSARLRCSNARRWKHFRWLTKNTGYPKLREHLGAVVATMKLSADWHDFRAKLDRLYPLIGKPTQLSLEFADEDADTGKGL
jgi:hypothetical protein